MIRRERKMLHNIKHSIRAGQCKCKVDEHEHEHPQEHQHHDDVWHANVNLIPNLS